MFFKKGEGVSRDKGRKPCPGTGNGGRWGALCLSLMDLSNLHSDRHKAPTSSSPLPPVPTTSLRCKNEPHPVTKKRDEQPDHIVKPFTPLVV